VTTTLDSGKTWLPLKTFTANNSNNETIIWVPKNSSTVPKYFGVKRCLIRIKDSEKDEFIDSDTFSLIGAIPMVLLDSLKNNTYQTTDSIKVQYGANMDLASNIQTYFKTDSMKNWVEFVRDINLPSPDAPTILNRQKCLILQTVDSMVKSEAQNFTQPIKILLKDYSATSYYIITDYITIDVM
jgi:hypothetical protein